MGRVVTTMVCCCAGSLAAAGAGPICGFDWTHLAGDAARGATAPFAPPTLDVLLWDRPSPPVEGDDWIFRSAPVAAAGRVYVVARRATRPNPANVVYCFDADDGALCGAHAIAPDVYDSNSTPALYGTQVLVASGDRLYALDFTLPQPELWSRELERVVVNASPCVSADLASNRVFITDFAGPFDDGTLYAVNLDPYDPARNPFLPGEVVWTAAVPGSSGNSPAYADGRVYVTSVSGLVQAFDAETGARAWATDIHQLGCAACGGFFGGLAVHDGAVYAATYNFFGGSNNSALFKLEAADGGGVWFVSCERTNSIPLAADGGLVLLSGGIEGFGSANRLQAFRDLGTSAELLWDTASASGFSVALGGWTHQPAYAKGRLYVGRPPAEDPWGTEFFGAYTDLYMIDPSKSPGEQGFIVGHDVGSGGSPAIHDGRLYSVGAGGLRAITFPAPCQADIDGDGIVDQVDLGILLGDWGYGSQDGGAGGASPADLNCDGVVDQQDLGILLAVYGGTCP